MYACHLLAFPVLASAVFLPDQSVYEESVDEDILGFALGNGLRRRHFINEALL